MLGISWRLESLENTSDQRLWNIFFFLRFVIPVTCYLLLLFLFRQTTLVTLTPLYPMQQQVCTHFSNVTYGKRNNFECEHPLPCKAVSRKHVVKTTENNTGCARTAHSGSDLSPATASHWSQRTLSFCDFFFFNSAVTGMTPDQGTCQFKIINKTTTIRTKNGEVFFFFFFLSYG